MSEIQGYAISTTKLYDITPLPLKYEAQHVLNLILQDQIIEYSVSSVLTFAGVENWDPKAYPHVSCA